MGRNLSWTGALAAVAALGWVVAGPQAAAHAQGPPPVSVSLAEWSVTPGAASVAAGDVTFNVSNNGTFPHVFVVFQTDLPADALPLAGSAVDESQLDTVGKLEALNPGSSGVLTLNLSAGRYVLICNVPGHYNEGMHTVFTVAAAARAAEDEQAAEQQQAAEPAALPQTGNGGGSGGGLSTLAVVAIVAAAFVVVGGGGLALARRRAR